MNQPWVYMCPSCWSPLPPPSPSHPSGSSQCAGPEHPVLCIEPGLAICLTYDKYMFQCYSLKSSHPLPLPQSPKVRSIHLCLFCCLTYRVIVTIFLNALIYCIGVFLSDLCCSVIHWIRSRYENSIVFFFFNVYYILEWRFHIWYLSFCDFS